MIRVRVRVRVRVEIRVRIWVRVIRVWEVLPRELFSVMGLR